MASTVVQQDMPRHSRRKAEIREILRCAHCNSVSFMPKQCRNGHIFCHLCAEELDGRCIVGHCSHGADSGKFARVLAIETMAQEFMWSCPRRSSGCPVKCEYDKMRAHEQTCCFHPRPCFIDAGQCRCVRHNRMDLLLHLSVSHGIASSECPEMFGESGRVVGVSMEPQGMFGDHILATHDGTTVLVFTMSIPDAECVGVVAVLLSGDAAATGKTVRARVTDAKQRAYVQEYPVFTLHEILATPLLDMYNSRSMLLFGRQLLKAASGGTNSVEMNIRIQ